MPVSVGPRAPRVGSHLELGSHLGWGAIFGAVVAVVEVHAVYVTTGRFDLGFAVANAIYLSVAFALAALAFGAAGLLGGGLRQAARLAILLALLLVIRSTVDGVFEILKQSRSQLGWTISRSVAVAAAGAVVLFGALWISLRRRALPSGAWFGLAAIGVTALLYLSELAPQFLLGELAPLHRFALVVGATALGTGLAVFGASRLPQSLMALVVLVLLAGPVAWRALVGPAEFSRVGGFAPPPSAGAAPDGPNVVLIVLDTLRADHMELYGHSRETMPELTRFAQRAAVYEQCISNSSWTLPSHASLFTGLYPREHGAEGGSADTDAAARSGARLLHADHRTLAEALGERGYATAGIGANWLWLRPRYGLGQGFQHWDVRPSYRGSMAEGYFALIPRTRTALDASPLRWFYEPLVDRDVAQVIYRRAEEITDSAVTQIERLGGADRPFFLFLNYMDPHDPYQAPAPFADFFPGRDPSLSRQWEGLKRAKVPPEVIRTHVAAQYDSELRYLDVHLGRLFAALEESQRLQDTIVILTSDHGEALGEHGNKTHGSSLYDEEIRVPLIVYDPASPVGARVATPVEIRAVMPWLLARTGASASPGGPAADGLANGGPTFAELYGVRGADWIAVRSERWKLIHRSDGKQQLFDLARDIEESDDLFGRNGAAHAAPLLAAIDQWKADVPAFDGGVRNERLSDQEILLLRELGYIE
jgi:arylsulfatase A-like enzyme